MAVTWNIQARGNGLEIRSDKHTLIATVHGSKGLRKQNAALISAAPKLLAKLIEIADGMNCVCRLNPLVGRPVPCGTCQIRALIAEATNG